MSVHFNQPKKKDELTPDFRTGFPRRRISRISEKDELTPDFASEKDELTPDFAAPRKKMN